MKRTTYMHGAQKEQYGIWNTVKKCWQFGICEDTPMLAEARLFQKIGEDARKWRFEARTLPKDMRKVSEVEILEKQLKDAVNDLESACASLPVCAQCQYCAHYPCSDEMNDECEESSQWEWRGFKKGGTDEK